MNIKIGIIEINNAVQKWSNNVVALGKPNNRGGCRHMNHPEIKGSNCVLDAIGSFDFWMIYGTHCCLVCLTSVRCSSFYLSIGEQDDLTKLHTHILLPLVVFLGTYLLNLFITCIHTCGQDSLLPLYTDVYIHIVCQYEIN